MSIKVGLGNCQDDVDIQGEIDFDFFNSPEENDDSIQKNGGPVEERQWSIKVSEKSQTISPDEKSPGTPAQTDTSVTVEVEYCQSPSLKGNFGDASTAVTYSDKNLLLNMCTPGPSDYPEIEVGRAIEAVSPASSSYDRVGTPSRTKYIETVIPKVEEQKSSRKSGGDSSKVTNGYHSISKEDGNASDDSCSFSEDSADSLDELSESESFTDVTPLQSPYWCESPLPYGQGRSKSTTFPDSQVSPRLQGTSGRYTSTANGISAPDVASLPHSSRKKENVKFCDEVRMDSSHEDEGADLDLVVEAIKQLELEKNTGLLKHRNFEPPRGKNRKNMSFSNDQVRQIDRENQRLLKKILAHQNRPRSKMACQPLSHVASSTVNRQRMQRQVEVDNLAMLKRLESAKPSYNISRTSMLKNYWGNLSSTRGSSVSSQMSSRKSSASSQRSGAHSAMSAYQQPLDQTSIGRASISPHPRSQLGSGYAKSHKPLNASQKSMTKYSSQAS